MVRSVYEDYKYSMQDTSCLYIGAKYTLDEITENEEIPFKFRKVCAESLRKGSDGEDTLETLLYYLEAGDFRIQVFKQMRAKARISIIREKKSITGKIKKEYKTEFIDIPKLVSMTKEDKEASGIVIQELRVNKLALLTV